MFDIGFWELIAVMAIGLMVLGPERMSQVVRTGGKWLGRARSMARNMQYELEREVAMSEFDSNQTIATPAPARSDDAPGKDGPRKDGPGKEDKKDDARARMTETTQTAADER